MMKTLFAAAALVVVAAGSPAGAQVYGDQWAYSGDDSLSAYAQVRPSVQQRRAGAAAALASHPDGRAHSPNPEFDVYDNQGHYAGSDPDPFIRNDLARDPPLRGDD